MTTKEYFTQFKDEQLKEFLLEEESKEILEKKLLRKTQDLKKISHHHSRNYSAFDKNETINTLDEWQELLLEVKPSVDEIFGTENIKVPQITTHKNAIDANKMTLDTLIKEKYEQKIKNRFASSIMQSACYLSATIGAYIAGSNLESVDGSYINVAAGATLSIATMLFGIRKAFNAPKEDDQMTQEAQIEFEKILIIDTEINNSLNNHGALYEAKNQLIIVESEHSKYSAAMVLAHEYTHHIQNSKKGFFNNRMLCEGQATLIEEHAGRYLTGKTKNPIWRLQTIERTIDSLTVTLNWIKSQNGAPGVYDVYNELLEKADLVEENNRYILGYSALSVLEEKYGIDVHKDILEGRFHL